MGAMKHSIGLRESVRTSASAVMPDVTVPATPLVLWGAQRQLGPRATGLLAGKPGDGRQIRLARIGRRAAQQSAHGTLTTVIGAALLPPLRIKSIEGNGVRATGMSFVAG